MNELYIPERGDIVWLLLDPRVGHEQSGRRPALVLSPKVFTRHTGLAVICPITSKVKNLPYEITLEGCQTQGVLLPIHVRSVDSGARKMVFIEKAPSKLVAKAASFVRVLIEEV